MIRSQGRYFTDEELRKIVYLLKETDMSLSDIAIRMRCSRSAIASINRKFDIRNYGGRRTRWVLAGADVRR
jgi:hypothetical protein